VYGAYLWSFATRKKLNKERITRGDDLGVLTLMVAKKKHGNGVKAGLSHPAKTPVHIDRVEDIETGPATDV
jgi:hypothetical protein